MRVAGFFLFLALLILIAATIKFPDSYMEVRPDQVFLDPSFHHYLGTDSLGRDYFWRLVLGLRTSIFVAVGGSIVSFVIGSILGSIAAWSGGHKAFFICRLFDVIQGLPSFLFLAVIMQFFVTAGAAILTFSLAFFCGVFHFSQLARLTYSQLLKEKQEPFVEAALSLGGTPLHILKKHLWPSAYALWVTWFCYQIPTEIMFESTLSFLGFGIQPPQTSLGLLINEGWQYLDDRPVFLFAPAIVSFLVVMSFRSLLKPKLIP